jgi:hypothetical protein
MAKSNQIHHSSKNQLSPLSELFQILPKSKSKQKSGLSTDIVIFNESSSRKVTKRLVHSGQCESKKQSVARDDGKSSVSGTRKKKRKRKDFPSTVKIQDSCAVHMELSNLPGSN